MIKKIVYLILFITLSCLLNAKDVSPRIALVIGNNDYSEWGELTNPIKDAKDIKKALEKLGFDTLYGENLKRKEFEELLIEFHNRLNEDKNSVGLFYFAGHGMEIGGTNYLIPIDSKSPKKYESIELDKIIDEMRGRNNRLSIIILDACRNNPKVRGKKLQRGGLSSIKAPTGLFIAYSTRKGEASNEGEEGENGLFTKYLLHYITYPLSLSEMFTKIRISVHNESIKNKFMEEQRPTSSDETLKEFYFTLPTQETLLPRLNPLLILKNNSIEKSIFEKLLEFFVPKSKLDTTFIIFFIFGISLIIFTSLTSFLYSQRTNYMLKVIAISIFFFGISGHIVGAFLGLSNNNLLLFISLMIAIFIFIFIVFFTPKGNSPENSQPISLIGSQAILLSDIKIGHTGHANIITDSSRYRKLVRNKSDENFFRGDEVIVMSDEAIPIVSKKYS
jgi:hypothetical protein